MINFKHCIRLASIQLQMKNIKKMLSLNMHIVTIVCTRMYTYLAIYVHTYTYIYFKNKHIHIVYLIGVTWVFVYNYYFLCYQEH